MTVIFACRDNEGNGAIACDTALSYGNCLKTVGSSKLVKFPNFIVGTSGSCTIQNILEELAEEEENELLFIGNAKDVRDLMRKVLKLAKPDYELNDQVKTGQDFTLLFLTCEGRIFCGFHDMSAIEYTDYTAIGSGREYALGATHALLTLKEEDMVSLAPADIASLAIEAADLCPSCDSYKMVIMDQNGVEYDCNSSL